MANTYYDSQLTAEESEAALEAISGLIVPANNGKVIAINNGKFEARSVQWGGGAPVIEALSVTENGTYTAPSWIDGYSPITVSVGGSVAGNVIIGTEIPTASVGDDGDFYLRQRDIPNTITFLEYLQSSGTQYIDTGIYATEKTSAIVKAKTLSAISSNIYLGARSGTYSAVTNAFVIQTGNYNGRYIARIIKNGTTAINSDIIKIKNVSANTEYELSCLAENDPGFPVLWCAPYTSELREINNYTADYSMHLFGINQATPDHSSAIIKRAVIYNGKALVADYLPCLDSNNVPCMYEAVSGEFVYNDGTGDFTYGQEITTPTIDNTLYIKEDGVWIALANGVYVNT